MECEAETRKLEEEECSKRLVIDAAFVGVMVAVTILMDRKNKTMNGEVR